jgi:ubiquinone/menaquinone biosynthesis C-methylase UbiE
MKIDIGTKQQVKSFYNKEWSYGMRSFSFEKGKKVFESIGIPEHSLSHKKVLDAGCGTGMYSVLLAKVYDSKVTAIDIEEECISIARHLAFSENAGHIIFKCISIVDLESDGNNYDTVISIGAVHHTNDALRCLESFYSVLKPGGECFISVIRSCMFTKVQKIIFNLYSKSPDFIKKIIYVLLLNLLRITAIFYHPLKTRFTDLNVGLRDALNCPYHQVEKDDHWCHLLSMAGFTETKKIRSWNIMGHQGLYYGKKEVGKGIEKEHGSKSL